MKLCWIRSPDEWETLVILCNVSGQNLNKTDFTVYCKNKRKTKPLWTGHITQTQHNFPSPMQTMHIIIHVGCVCVAVWGIGICKLCFTWQKCKKKNYYFVSFFVKTNIMSMLYTFINIDIIMNTYGHIIHGIYMRESIIFPSLGKAKQIFNVAIYICHVNEWNSSIIVQTRLTLSDSCIRDMKSYHKQFVLRFFLYFRIRDKSLS